MLRIPFKWFEFAFEWWNLVGMVRICIRMLRISSNDCIRMLRILMVKIAFESLKFGSNGSNLYWNASNLFSILKYECFGSLSNGYNLHLNVSNHVRYVRICIRIVRIPFEWSEFAVSNFVRMVQICCLESLLNVRICIQMLRISLKWFEFAFKWFKCLLTGSSLHSNASNSFRMVRICIWMLQVWFEIAFECFESLSNG